MKYYLLMSSLLYLNSPIIPAVQQPDTTLPPRTTPPASYSEIRIVNLSPTMHPITKKTTKSAVTRRMDPVTEALIRNYRHSRRISNDNSGDSRANEHTRRSIVIPTTAPGKSGECSGVKVLFRNIASSVDKPTVIMRSEGFIVESHIDTGCYQANATIVWYRSHIMDNQDKIITSVPIIEVQRNALTWSIIRNSLDYGTYAISEVVNLRFEVYEISAEEKGYIKIIPTPIRAIIKGGLIIRKWKHENFTLDGSSSYDPDQETSAQPNFTYRWQFNIVDNYIPATSSILHVSNDSSLATTEDTGSPALIIYPKGRSGILKVMLIIREQITGRVSNYTQVVNIASKNMPGVLIRCIENCDSLVKPLAVLELETVSFDPRGEGHEQPLFKGCHWTLETVSEDGSMLRPWSSEDLLASTVSGTNSCSIHVKDDTLSGGENYLLTVHVMFNTTTIGREFYSFRTRVPPHGGKCEVNINEGVALETKFIFGCKGWKGESTLMYERFYVTDEGLKVVLHYGSDKISPELLLSEGLEKNNFTINITVRVLDSVGEWMDSNIAVRVLPQNKTIDYSSVLDNDSKTEGQRTILGLLNVRDVQGASQLADTALTSMHRDKNSVSSDEKSKRKMVIQTIIQKFSEVEVKSLPRLVQVAAVLAKATSMGEYINLDTQETCISALENLSEFLLKKAQEKEQNGEREDELESTVECGTNLVHGLGIALNNAKNTGRTKNNTDNKRSKALVRKSWVLVDIVSAALFPGKILGSEPIKIQTESLNLWLDRKESSKIGSSSLGGDFGTMDLPDSSQLFDNKTTKHNSVVDVQMKSAPFNPFNWGQDAYQIKSAIVDLKFRDDQQNEIPVNNIPSHIDMFLPVKHNDVTPMVDKVKTNQMMMYKIPRTPDDTTILNLRPIMKDSKIIVYVGYTKRPNKTSYDFRTVLPADKNCTNITHCVITDNPYAIILSNPHESSTKSLYYVGVAPFDKNEFTQSTRNITGRVRRSLCTASARQRRDCVQEMNPPGVVTGDNDAADIEYSFSWFMLSCKYWIDYNDTWSSSGCTTGPRSTPSQVHCMCNHLTAFGGGFHNGLSNMFVKPNPIDFDKVLIALLNLDESGNIVVMVAVAVILAFYLIAVLAARRADNKDFYQTGLLTKYTCSPRKARNFYQIDIQTGMWGGSGTSANVFIILHGDEDNTPPVKLENDNGKFFTRASTNQFLIGTANSLGDIHQVHIWHDNTGESPNWNLIQVSVKDMRGKKGNVSNNDTIWTFVFNQWLAVEREDGRVDTVLKVASPEEMKAFQHVFYSRLSQAYGDSHLWFSVRYLPPASSFTRVQRITCCLTLLLSMMIVNAMFYNISGETEDTLELGPLRFSVRQLIIGVQSGFIAGPINLIIINLFRNAQSRPSKAKKYQPVSPSSQESNGNDNEETTSKRLTVRQCCAVYCFAPLAWILCILTCAASAAFTIMYSLMWGKDAAGQWLTSILVSFFQDICIIQPLKVLFIAAMLALIFKKPLNQKAEKDEEKDIDIHQEIEPLLQKQQVHSEDDYTSKSEDEENNARVPLCKPPSATDLETSRDERLKELRMYRVIAQFMAYLFFLWLLMVVCYGGKNMHLYQLTTSLESTFFKIDKVKDIPSYWDWNKNFFVPQLFSDVDDISVGGVTADQVSVYIGMPRLRQLRVKQDTCVLPRGYTTARECNDVYKLSNEYKVWFHRPGWKSIKEIDTKGSIEALCPKPWRYHSDYTMRDSIWGHMALYSGGGYIAELGYSTHDAHKALASLQRDGWVDLYTRVVLIEFTVFNPYTNTSSHVTGYIERLPTGGIFPSFNIHSFQLYMPSSSRAQSFYVVCQVLIVLAMLIIVIMEIRQLIKQGRQYFKVFWNWVEIMQVVMAITATASHVSRAMVISSTIKEIRQNPYASVNMSNFLYWDYVDNLLIAITMVIATIKLLSYIRFNVFVCIFAETLKNSRSHLASYFVVFLVLFLAFGQFGMLVFVGMYQYADVKSTMVSQFEIVLGGQEGLSVTLENSNRILGPIYYLLYVCAMLFILMNVFVVILNETFSESSDPDMKLEDAELGEYMYKRFVNFFTCSSKQSRSILTLDSAGAYNPLTQDTKTRGKRKIMQRRERKNMKNRRKMEQAEKMIQEAKPIIDKLCSLPQAKKPKKVSFAHGSRKQSSIFGNRIDHLMDIPRGKIYQLLNTLYVEDFCEDLDFTCLICEIKAMKPQISRVDSFPEGMETIL